MEERPEDAQDRARRRGALILTVVTILLWAIAVALPTWVLVVIGNLPSEDSGRMQRAITIATGGFATFAVPAVAASIGLVLVRRARRRRLGG